MAVNYVGLDIYRMRASVALVEIEDVLEIYRSNVRESKRIRISYDGIVDLLFQFNGECTLQHIAVKNNLDLVELAELVHFLNQEYVLILVDAQYDSFEDRPRLHNTLEEYCNSMSEVKSKLSMLDRKTVLVVGMGAVGTWVVQSLAMSGVSNFILVDDDKVEVSNIHRQSFMFEDDIGLYKVDVVRKALGEIGINSIQVVREKIDQDFFFRKGLNFDLAINCSDYPSVDATSELVAAYCMPLGIPHMIGGGYNLHLTLVGQAVIPGETACFKCFEGELSKLNSDSLHGVKKLDRPTRKIGSFGPLCSLSASITSIEAFKILIESFDSLTAIDNRVEFQLTSMDFSQLYIGRSESCPWCGINGLYSEN